MDLRSKFGITVYTMASPFGDASYPPLAATRYLINRGVDDGTDRAQRQHRPVQHQLLHSPARAPAEHVQHRDRRGPKRPAPGRRCSSTASRAAATPLTSRSHIGEFTASVNHAKSFGDVWIDSVRQRRRLLARAEGVRRRSRPRLRGIRRRGPGRCPRTSRPARSCASRVDGGTLTQPGGRTLTWDDHGYYEVALDAGSLTLSP